MIFKKYTLFLILFSCSTIGFAGVGIDSIGVENSGGKKIIIHKVDPKETYFSLSRRYNVTAKAIQDFNGGKLLQPGMTIRIPTDLAFVEQKVTNSAGSSEIIEYKVAPKEYLGVIAKKFNTTVESIKELNNLTSNNLAIGQTIKIRPGSNASAPIQATVSTAEAKKPSATASQINKNVFDLIEYKVGPREYLSIIAEKFHTSIEDIRILNNLKSDNLSIGQVLKIRPGEKSTPSSQAQNAVAEKAPDAAVAKNTQGDVVEYKVGTKETLSSIAKKFNTSVEDIKALNSLKSSSVNAGQIIKVRYASAQTGLTPNILRPGLPSTSDSASKDTTIINATDRLRRPVGVYGLTEILEKGVGIWIDDENIDATKMLALHRTAPIGTIIKVTNPMTGRSTFAKVVGKFNENENTKDIIVVISKAAADVIGVLDKRFQTSIVYGTPKE